MPRSTCSGRSTSWRPAARPACARSSSPRRPASSASSRRSRSTRTIQVEPDSPYGASKLAAEKECLAYAKLYDLEAVCLRYFNVYGPNQRFDAYGNVIPIFVFQMLRGEPVTIFGDGEQTRDFINVRDVVQANLKAGDSVGVSGAFNLGSGTRITINALVSDLAALMDEKPDVRSGPPRPGDVRDSLADISKARSALGFEPSVDLPDGLAEYVAWARTEVAG